MTVWTAHPDWTLRNYAGPAVIAAGGTCQLEVCSLFYPTGTRPLGGWPLVVMPLGGGWRLTFCPSTISSDAPEDIGTRERTAARLLNGDFGGVKYAVLLVAVPIARGFANGLPTISMEVTFRGTLAGTNVPLMTVNSAGLTGGGSYSAATVTPGGSGVDEIQSVTVTGTVSGGTYTITWNGQTTAAIAWNANPTDVEAAMLALSNLAPGDVFVHSGAKQTGNPVDDTVLDLDSWENDSEPESVRYGPAYNGNGMVVAELGSGSFAVPNLYDGVTHPVHDLTRPNWMRACAMYPQWVWWNAPAMGVDRTRIIGHGGSQGALCVAWTYYQKNLAEFFFPGGVDQDAVDTRIWRTAGLRAWQSWFPLFQSTPTPCIEGTGNCYMSSFPRKPTSGGDPYVHYDKQSQALSQVTAGTLNTLSALTFCEDVEVFADNAARPTWMWFGTEDDVGPPYDRTQTLKTAFAHSVWFGGAMKTMFPENTRLLTGGQQGELFTATVDAEIDDGIDLDQDLIEFFNEHAAVVEPVEELALRAVEDELRTVTSANGYLTDVKLVQRGEEMADELRQYPAVMTTAIDADYSDREFHPSVVGSARMAAVLVLRDHDQSTRRTLVSRFIADVRKALQLRLTTDNFGGIVHDIHIRKSHRWLNDELTTPICGATLELEVMFRDAHSDPYTPT